MTDMAGEWVCCNCDVPMPYEKTEQTRCPTCGLQMDWIRAREPELTGIEREFGISRTA